MTEKVWLKSYPQGVPAEIDADAYSSLIGVFDECSQKYSKLPAYENMGHTITYEEVEVMSRRLAAYLQTNLGLVKGDRFAIMLPNVLQYPIALFAALRCGLTVVNVNPLYTVRELAHQLKNSEAKAIIVLDNFAHVLQETLPHVDIKHIIVTSMGDLFPFVKRHVVNFVVRSIKKMVAPWSIEPVESLRDILQHTDMERFVPVEVNGDDIAFLQYTGGTTGVAKGAILTHRNMVANLLQTTAWVQPFIQERNEVAITALPLYHIFSLMANCLLFMKYGALNILITNPRDIPGFVKTLRKTRFTIITGVNTLFNALLNHHDFKKINFNDLVLTLGGGMSVQEDVAKRWQAITKKPMLEGYGLTETSPVICISPLSLKQYNGKAGLPVPSTEVLIRDRFGRSAPFNHPGEICVKGPQVTQGYWQMPAETHKIFTDEGWLLTGDIGMLDEQGYLSIVDRKKDMILVSGFNVYPNEVEDVIVSHPHVSEVAVVGVPNDVTGEQVKAFVVRKSTDLTEEVLISFCREQLTGYKVPKLIEFRDDLPKTNVGKILRRALREEPAVDEKAPTEEALEREESTTEVD